MQRIIFMTSLLISFLIGFSQSSQTVVEKNEELLKVASEIITEAGLCALITYDSAGKVNVRTMQPFSPEDDFTIWFGTNSQSRKVSDIMNDPNVVLYYASPDASGYVVLNGRAMIIDDNNLKQKYWMESWEDFYEEDKSNYLLIKVMPESMEMLSTKHGIAGDTITWSVPTIRLK